MPFKIVFMAIINIRNIIIPIVESIIPFMPYFVYVSFCKPYSKN